MDSNLKYQHVTLNISGANAGQQISISIEPTDNNKIGWSTGPNFEGSSGITVNAQSGTLPLSSLSINPEQLKVQTAGTGGSITVQLTIFVVADAAVSAFYLKSESDTNIVVSAAIGNANPQVVNQTNTVFLWGN